MVTGNGGDDRWMAAEGKRVMRLCFFDKKKKRGSGRCVRKTCTREGNNEVAKLIGVGGMDGEVRGVDGELPGQE